MLNGIRGRGVSPREIYRYILAKPEPDEPDTRDIEAATAAIRSLMSDNSNLIPAFPLSDEAIRNEMSQEVFGH